MQFVEDKRYSQQNQQNEQRRNQLPVYIQNEKGKKNLYEL